MGDRELLDEQIRYYRARASEYDATSPGGHDPFEPDLDQARRALRAFAPRGRVLELAAGTGLWTGILADLADELVATDASPEMLALNRGKVGERRNVRYEVADAFDPGGEAFDVIFFGFFLSHVPHDRFDAFWATLRRRLAPGGRVFFVDEAEHGLWREDWIDEGAGIVRRTLTDGTEHRAVKVLWRPEALGTRLIGLGWHAAIQASGPFYWGSGVPISPG
jgi:demethylmenaquinone methyltransferase/2-methoxy-6-polyprenyl-1,4-benzoquinol methylase